MAALPPTSSSATVPSAADPSPDDVDMTSAVDTSTPSAVVVLASDDESDDDAKAPDDPPAQPLPDIDNNAKEIDLTNMRLRELPDLSKYKRVETLVARLNFLTGMGSLAAAPQLVSVDLYDNRFKKIDGLTKLTKLKKLDLSFNECRVIQGLDNCTALEELFLINNKIPRIPPNSLASLTNLVMLELGSNRIRTIEHLNSLVNLRQLYLGRNKITSLKGLEKLVKLERLSVQSNRLTSIGDHLHTLVNLQELYLSHNGLQEIEGLDHLTKLKVLDLAGNKLTRLDNLSHLACLEDLWVNNNQLEDWSEVEKLVVLTSLDTLYLEQNPLWKVDDEKKDDNAAQAATTAPADDSNKPKRKKGGLKAGLRAHRPQTHDAYRKRVIALLPNLAQLDADLVE